MKLSTVLLSSAALLVAGAAYAADLPAKKAAPAAAPTGCAAFGAGFISIPGGDTCLKISGYVRSNNTYNMSTVARGTAPYSMTGYWDMTFDARNQTEIGTVQSVVEFYNNTNEYAYINVAGFQAGTWDDNTDIGISGINGDYSGLTSKGLQYSAPLGGNTTISVAAVTAVTTYGGVTSSGRPDLQLAVATGSGPFKANVVAVSHEAAGSASGTANAYALVGNASVAMGDATAKVYGAYAQGASAYVIGSPAATLYDAATDSSGMSSGSNVGAKLSYNIGKGSLSVFGNAANVTGATGSTTSYKSNNMGVNYALTVAKGLTVTPELWNSVTNTGSGNSTAQSLYLRIQRDF